MVSEGGHKYGMIGSELHICNRWRASYLHTSQSIKFNKAREVMGTLFLFTVLLEILQSCANGKTTQRNDLRTSTAANISKSI